MNFSRRKMLLGGAAAVAAGFVDMRWIEPHWLQIKHRTVALPNTSGLKPIKLLHLSDLHLSEYVSLGQIESAIDHGLKLEPDLVCITGDFISQEMRDPSTYAESLKRIRAHCPVYACAGNHDGGGWARNHGGYQDLSPLRELLEKADIQLLENEGAKFTCDAGELQLVGVGDLWAGDLQATRAFGKADSAAPTVLLSHNPDSKDQLMKKPWQLMLSGHTHGGQLRVPFSGATPFAPVSDHRYVQGLHLLNDRYLHVSKGVGNLMGVRLNCRPEITLLTLQS